VELDPAALAQHKLRVTLLRCRVAELDVVINEAGQTNLLNLFAGASAQVVKSGGIRVTGKLVDFDGIDVFEPVAGQSAVHRFEKPAQQSRRPGRDGQ